MPNNSAPKLSLSGGKVITNLGGEEGGVAVLQQTDGKIVVAANLDLGFQGGTSNVFSVLRYNPDGALDADFGFHAGYTAINIDTYNDYVTDLAIQADGKILVVGEGNHNNLSAENNSYFGLLRFNPDGHLDSTFGGNGFASVNISLGMDVPNSVIVQSDGKIVLFGSSDNGREVIAGTNGNGREFSLARFNADGTLDNTFGIGGVVAVNSDLNYVDGFSCVQQADGKLLVTGTENPGIAGENNAVIMRFNTDGSVDTSFGVDGKVVADMVGSSDYPSAINIVAGGKILISGGGDFAGTDVFAMMQFNPDGSVDTTFGNNGLVTAQVDGTSTDAVIQPDGKIILAGTTYDPLDSTNEVFTVVRFNPDGSLDMSFGQQGRVDVDVGRFADEAMDVTLQSDGRLLITGNIKTGAVFSDDIAVIRLNNDGSLDTSFNGVSYVQHGAPVILDSKAFITDAELDVAVNGYEGSTLTLVRHGGANAADHFSGVNIIAGTTAGNVIESGVTIGTYSYADGELTIAFNNAATKTLVNQAIQSIAYSNDNALPDENPNIDWIFNDGNTGSQGTGGALMTVANTTIHPPILINHAPYGTSTSSLPYGYQDVPYTISYADLLQGFFDPDGDVLSVANLVSHNGTYVDNLDGTLTFTPDAGYSGYGIFIFDVIDNRGGVALGSQTFTIFNSRGDLYLEGNYLDNIQIGDAIHSGSFDVLLGKAGDDNLSGMAGNDYIHGGSGIDIMSGGLGDDILVVENAADSVIENAGEGIDAVWTYINYTLGSNVEKLVILGHSGINGTGNALDNTLYGNAASNTLTGKGGNDLLNGLGGEDTMIGGYGDDTYVVDDSLDMVVELSNQGRDLVKSFISYTLGDNVEKLTLVGGSLNIHATGNAKNNVLMGNDGSNILAGGGGTDTMTGGLGADTFDFNALSELAIGGLRDVVRDFDAAQGDKLDFSDIDAIAGSADDAFTFIGSGAFSIEGEIRFQNGIVYLNTDNDTAAEYAVQLVGVASLSASDIVL